MNEILKQIACYADAAPDSEVCGVVILDKETGIAGVVPVRNIVQGRSAMAEFTMDPMTWVRLQKEVRLGKHRKFELVYRWHSHPRWPAWPSSYDIYATAYPQRELIYSVSMGKFVCYGLEEYLTTLDTNFDRTPLAQNGHGNVHLAEYTDYSTTTNPEASAELYESYDNWRGRNWELPSAVTEQPDQS